MKLKSIFQKPVDRRIEGVIKADDETCLRTEIEEYVLTREVSKNLEEFLYAYNNIQDSNGANGVWISGFFGSGKSHLLKILAMLLENRTIDGQSVVELFLPKCGDNEIFRGDLKKACAIPSKSILFNIDQKADIISKTQIDALLAVFMKVFDEMGGYYGKQGHIAQFERDLDSRGLLQGFRDEYQRASGKPWERGREQALLEAKNIAVAYASVAGESEASVMGILDKYRSTYKVSIEDFAEKVNEFISHQPKGFRLNFMVDEVGQYIADNTKLMTNLQTIAESLGTICKGRAWLIVTAQEDMTRVVGEMTRKQGNDFTKIQARFKNRLKLTSADVAEVIQKRLLAKTDEGVEILNRIYHQHVNNFKTLFSFTDGSHTYHNFRDPEHFVHSYPFIPYQYPLFQAAITGLSDHGAFEGKHSSVGERSMLAVFQQVAIRISEHRPGQLASFDLMFEGIRSALKASIQRTILQAEDQYDDVFAVKLLKALFLVKYVKEFRATIPNLCILMMEELDQDLPSLRKRVEEGLNLLEQQTCIQRNGGIYDYLTNEEQDVEQEIKNTPVENSEIMGELEKIIFDQVIKYRKIRYDGNNQDFSFTRKLDDRQVGRESELAIHVVTPLNENAEKDEILCMQSMGRDELLVVMPVDDRYTRDMLMYKKTEKYIRQNINSAQQEVVKNILVSRGTQNSERYKDLSLATSRLLGEARLFVAGKEIEVSGHDPQNRIVQGFNELITRVYIHLPMIGRACYTENEIGVIIKDYAGGLFDDKAGDLSEAEREILSAVNFNKAQGVRTTIKSLIEKFERKPYGWGYATILCYAAKLCLKGKIEARSDSNQLEGNDLEKALRNTHGHGNVIVEPQPDFSASQIRRLKDFFADFFDEPPKSSEARALGKETAAAFKNLLEELLPLSGQSAQFPFLASLNQVMDQFKKYGQKTYDWFLLELPPISEELLELKEKTLEPIRKFMSGSQKEIYLAARQFVAANQPNFDYVKSHEASELVALFKDPECYRGVKIQKIKELVDRLISTIDALLHEEKARAAETVQKLEVKLRNMPEFALVDQDTQQKLSGRFVAVLELFNEHRLIAVIRDAVHRFETEAWSQILNQLMQAAQPRAQEKKTKTASSSTASAGNKAAEPGLESEVSAASTAEKPAEIILGCSIRIDFARALLANENDVDEYVDVFKRALLKEIKQGKRIQI